MNHFIYEFNKCIYDLCLAFGFYRKIFRCSLDTDEDTVSNFSFSINKYFSLHPPLTSEGTRKINIYCIIHHSLVIVKQFFPTKNIQQIIKLCISTWYNREKRVFMSSSEPEGNCLENSIIKFHWHFQTWHQSKVWSKKRPEIRAEIKITQILKVMPNPLLKPVTRSWKMRIGENYEWNFFTIVREIPKGKCYMCM